MRSGALLLLLAFGIVIFVMKEATKPPSPARQAYQDFAQLVADQKWDDASARAKGSALQYVEGKKKDWYRIARQIGPDTASRNSREISGITYAVESETLNGTTTSLTVVQTIEMANPNSPNHVRYNKERHVVTIEPDGAGFKIASVLATKAD